MPDLKTAMGGAGFRDSKPQENRGGGARPGNPNAAAREEDTFPAGYPQYLSLVLSVSSASGLS